MSAYVIFVRHEITNSDELKTYSDLAAKARTPAVNALVHYGKLEKLEGDDSAEGIVVLEFPTVADAREWYDSPAYREARKHRQLGANYSVYLVEGLQPQ